MGYMWIIRVYLNHFIFGWFRRIMRIFYKFIGLGVILFAFLALPQYAKADTFTAFNIPVTKVGNYYETDTYSQNIVWYAHWDGASAFITPETAGEYEIYYSLNNGAWQTFSSSDGSCNNTAIADGTNGINPCTRFGLFALQTPRPASGSSTMTLTKNVLKLKIRVPEDAELTSPIQFSLFTLTAEDYKYPALESVITCDSLDLICKGGEMIKTLFIPDQEKMTMNINDLKEAVNNKVPFAYLSAAYALGSDLDASNSATPTTLAIPYSSASVSAEFGVPQNITGSFPSFVVGYINAFKTALSLVFYLLFVVYIIVRFRHRIL